MPRISRDDLKHRLEGPADQRPLIVDVRLKYPYEHSTLALPGAIRTGPGQMDVSRLSRDREIVLYDSDPGELVSAPLAQELIAAGFRAMVLAGGIGEWVTAKFPTETKSALQSAPPAPGALKG